jgi:hypothetical protein
MALPRAELYKLHVRNLRAVDVACSQVFRQLKHCLSARQDRAADALLKTFILLVGAWAEVRLLKLLHEKNGFSNGDRASILAVGSKIDQWNRALEIGFRRRYEVPHARLTRRSLPLTVFLRYQEIASIVKDDLRPIIEIRNKLAHGQWTRTLNNDMTDVSEEMMALLNAENALSANFKKQILEKLSRILHDLVIPRLLLNVTLTSTTARFTRQKRI